MKKIILLSLIAMCLCASKALAQTYVVYKVSGAVTQQTSKGKTPLKVGAILSPQATLSIPYNASAQLVNVETSERYVLKNPGSGNVESMVKDSKNTISKVTKQYLDYMLAQVVDGGKSIKMEHSDVATVTRQLQEIAKKQTDDFDDDFEAFRAEVDKEFENFRDSVNTAYAEFMKHGWREFNSKPGEKKPKDEHVQPVVTTLQQEKKPTDRFWFVKKDKVVKAPVVKAQPTPLDKIKEVANKDAQQTVNFEVWGTKLSVRFNKSDRFTLPDLNPETISNAWVKLSSQKYNNLIRDCIDLRFEKQLGDWAYLKMLQEVSNVCMGGAGNEATLLTAYIYCQSGYRMRLCKDGDKLFILYGSEFYIYDKDYYQIDGEYFYPLDTQLSRLSICNVPYPNERSLSFQMKDQQKFDYEEGKERVITSQRFPDMRVSVKVNQHLIDFYNTYPTSTLGQNFMTRWAMYANTPLEDEVKDQIYPQLRKKIEGKTKLEAANFLLNFLQTGLPYEYDENVWGEDRAFFAEESLYYPSCDCEDRSILLSRLVRDLLGLKVVLVYYPGHLATAVNFGDEPVQGTYYELDGERYYVCDPTIIGWGAPVGQPMNMFENCEDVSLILLDNDNKN